MAHNDRAFLLQTFRHGMQCDSHDGTMAAENEPVPVRQIGQVFEKVTDMERFLIVIHRTPKANEIIIRQYACIHISKLDKVAVPAYERYRFFERRGIDRARIESLIDRYHRTGVCRKQRLGDRIVNAF